MGVSLSSSLKCQRFPVNPGPTSFAGIGVSGAHSRCAGEQRSDDVQASCAVWCIRARGCFMLRAPACIFGCEKLPGHLVVPQKPFKGSRTLSDLGPVAQWLRVNSTEVVHKFAGFFESCFAWRGHDDPYLEPDPLRRVFELGFCEGLLPTVVPFKNMVFHAISLPRLLREWGGTPKNASSGEGGRGKSWRPIF